MASQQKHEHDLIHEGGRLIGHLVAIVVGFVMMVIGLGMGVTMVLLPVGIPLGLFGLGLFLWGVLEYFDKRRGENGG